MGEYKRGFQAFYISKPKEAKPLEAKRTLSKFAKAHGLKEDAVDVFHKGKNVHVGIDESVWFFGEKGDSAMEFKPSPDGTWRSKRHGKPSGGFLEKITHSSKMMVFKDPVEFLLFHEKGGATPRGGMSHFVMFDASSSKRLDEILALNSHIKEVHIAQSAPAGAQKERNEVHEMNKRFNPFDIHVKELTLGGIDKRSRTRP